MGIRSFIHRLTAPSPKRSILIDEEVKMVFIINSELKMGKGKIAAQVGHAAVSSTLKSGDKTPELLEAWLASGQKKICVKGNDAEHLLQLEKQSRERDITTVKINDAGHTQIPSGSLTVLSLGPDLETNLNKITGDLKLL
ncbi:MAG: peptidyl-tRNA hydrolase [Euryarchaeota archaeon TMED248]|nr:MAG: peptidyl-tRNA hydrolase [Euryarchaeota archaeon TMED248]|tara:strand:+ start:3007 stop:3426 length:420 start_codon:yes stop_codon:yes gene_type:complete